MVGQSIAHYKVTAKLGAGGMGEVYRASDTKLNRDVALKVLPEAFAADAQRMARFQREAQVLASLNHPNIATIHGLEESGSVRALVMELVEGPTLAERIASGPLPLDEALPIAKQIAEALEYAHEHNIIHRDLKPANIKLTPEGKAKVLDFGLAKALQDDPSTADVSTSPTLSIAATKAGIVLGTAAYMSPEQAKGKPVDRRADIWAFGVVLYEMLTGRGLYTGETASEVMAHVITKEPDFTAVSAAAPGRLIHLLRRCLAKDPGVRLRDIGEARITIAEILAHPAADREAGEATPVGERKRRSWLLASGVALCLLAGVVLTWFLFGGLRQSFRSGPQVAPRLSITLPDEAPFYVEYYPGLCLAISRDGLRVVYSSRGKARRLYLRRLDELEVRPIPGTEGGTAPFFSPDGEWVAFFTLDGALKKVSLAGGNPVTLVRGMPHSFFLIGSWAEDGRIVFDTWNAGLRIVSANGGEVKTLTAPKDEWHQDPHMLPGSDIVLYLALRADAQRIEALLPGGGHKVILENASHGRYLASGHLLFVRDGGLMVAPFDAKRLEVTGPASPVSLNVMFDDVRVYAPTPQLAVSLTGTLVYAPGWSGGRQTELVWVDRSGRTEELATLPLTLPVFQLSPDGRRLALATRVGPMARIQTLDLATKALTRIADEPQDNPMVPVWSPDGRRVFFTRYGTHQGTLLVQDLDSNSPPHPLLDVRGTYLGCSSVSRDGRFLFYTFLRDSETGTDIWMLDLGLPAAAKEAARPFLATSGNEDSAVLSPDGRWLAYSADESGDYEIYIRRFPGGESKQRVSTDGGMAPQWSADGRELFFQAEVGNKMMVAPVRSGPDLRVDEPRVLFEGSFVGGAGSAGGAAYAVSRDARRFLMVRLQENPFRASELIVVQNWFAELENKQKK